MAGTKRQKSVLNEGPDFAKAIRDGVSTLDVLVNGKRLGDHTGLELDALIRHEEEQIALHKQKREKYEQYKQAEPLWTKVEKAAGITKR